MNFMSFFKDINGQESSKRLYTAVFVLLFVVLFVANLFFKLTVKDSIEDYLVGLIAYMFTGVLIEGKFKKIAGQSTPPPEENKQ